MLQKFLPVQDYQDFLMAQGLPAILYHLVFLEYLWVLVSLGFQECLDHREVPRIQQDQDLPLAPLDPSVQAVQTLLAVPDLLEFLLVLERLADQLAQLVLAIRDPL